MNFLFCALMLEILLLSKLSFRRYQFPHPVCGSTNELQHALMNLLVLKKSRVRAMLVIAIGQPVLT